MKRLHLFEALGLVDDRLVEEAADAKRPAVPWGKWLAAAACIALAVSLGTAAGGTLLRGCGTKQDSGTVDTAPAASAPDVGAPGADSAPTDAAPSADPAPADAAPSGLEEMQGASNAQASPMETADAPEAEVAEPTAPPEPSPESEKMQMDGSGGLTEESSPEREPPVLGTDTGDLAITLLETDGEQTRYRVENLGGTSRTAPLYFTVATGGETIGENDLEIQVNGETVPFETYEQTTCPAADGALPEQTEQSYLVAFAAEIPAQEDVEIVILYQTP